jgi:hypothetical protein
MVMRSLQRHEAIRLKIEVSLLQIRQPEDPQGPN